MFDTYVTIVGNVLTAPEWKRTTNTKTPVTTFKVASTARRLDRESGTWVDGNNLRVRVTCWRRLAENVAASVKTGDPLVVFGRLFTRDWTDDDGNRRTMYELEAVGVGHDLSRGQGTFARTRHASTSDSAEGDGRALGEAVEPISGGPTSGSVGDGPEVAGAEAESVSDSVRGEDSDDDDLGASSNAGSVDDELAEVLVSAGSLPEGRGRRKARTPVGV